MAGKTMKAGRRMRRHMKKGGSSCGCAVDAAPVGAQSAGKRRSLRSSAKRSYRKRIAASKCRGLHTAKCRSNKSCKMAFGKKRSFCRKVRNTHRAKKH